MSLSYGKVGISPGTTTLNIGRGGSVTVLGQVATQDPGVTRRNIYGHLMGPSVPTDFDQAARRGYVPVHRGWISAKLDGAGLGACCSSCATGGTCSGELGEEVATVSNGKPLDPNQQKAIAQFVVNQLTLEEKALELKERRSRRFWGAIAGMAAGTTALVAVLQYFKKV
jgi:hypothetical protein